MSVWFWLRKKKKKKGLDRRVARYERRVNAIAVMDVKELWLGICLFTSSPDDGSVTSSDSHGLWTASGFQSGKVSVFTGNREPREVFILYGHCRRICSVSFFLQDEDLVLVTLDVGGRVCYWGVEKGECLGKSDAKGNIESTCVVSDRYLCYLCSGTGGRIDVLDLVKREIILNVKVPWTNRISTVIVENKQYLAGYDDNTGTKFRVNLGNRQIIKEMGSLTEKSLNEPLFDYHCQVIDTLQHGGMLAIGNTGAFVAIVNGSIAAFWAHSIPKDHHAGSCTTLIDCRKISSTLWTIFMYSEEEISSHVVDLSTLVVTNVRSKKLTMMPHVDLLVISHFDYSDDDYEIALVDMTRNFCICILDQEYEETHKLFVHENISKVDPRSVTWKSRFQLHFGQQFYFDTRTDMVHTISGWYPNSLSESNLDFSEIHPPLNGIDTLLIRDNIKCWVVHVEKLKTCDNLLLSLLSLLMHWEVSDSLDKKIGAVLNLSKPTHDQFRFLVDYRDGMYCLLASNSERWKCSDRFTAFQTLGMISLFISLISFDTLDQHQQAMLSSLVSHYGIVYPEHLIQKNQYSFPCLDILSHFILSASVGEDIKIAARLLLQVSIERMPLHMRTSKADQWAASLHISKGTNEFAVVVLGMIGVTHPGNLAPPTAKLVAKSLCALIRSPKEEEIIIAAELLARGFFVWFPHIVDLSLLVRDLLMTQGTVVGASPVSSACQRTLTEIGTNQPLVFINTLGKEALKPGLHHIALVALGNFIKRKPIAIVRFLPTVVEIVIKTLDPSESDVRKACLKNSTMVLHQLVKRYPMASFHQQTQRFALGTTDGVIVIYCLRTATKWRILEGHTAPVSALTFEPSLGELIVSYSAQEKSIRLWKTGASNSLFGGFLGFQGSCLKETNVVALVMESAPTLSDVVHNCNITWDTLVREDGISKISLHGFVA